MSFGWSAGDIAFALQILDKVVSGLKAAGGASSAYQETSGFLDSLQKTLEHLRIFSSTTFDPVRLEELRTQVAQLRGPVTRFVDDVNKFEPALASTSKRGKLLAAPRKIQWALKMPGKLKTLQDEVTIPILTLSLLLGSSVLSVVLDVQSTLPADIHIQTTNALRQHLPSLLATGLEPLLNEARKQKNEALTAYGQSTSHIKENMEQSADLVIRSIDTNMQAEREAIMGLRQTMESVGNDICTTLTAENFKRTTSHEILMATLSARRRELAGLDYSIRQTECADLTTVWSQHGKLDGALAFQMKELGKQFRICALLLIASLHNLIEKLLMIVAPHILAMFKLGQATGRLLLPGENFIFEDALGHIHKLPTLQFQQWNVFYAYLSNSFKQLPGSNRVSAMEFQILNNYSGVVIDKSFWQAVIQPNAHVAMAMMMQGEAFNKDRCPICHIILNSVSRSRSMKCGKCNKILTILPSKYTHENPNNFILEPRAFDNKALPETAPVILETKVKTHLPLLEPEILSLNATPVDISLPTVDSTIFQRELELVDKEKHELKAFKRVALSPSRFKDLVTVYGPNFGSPSIEIVAIHPLDGHPWRSFSADYDPASRQSPEINWLRDILPKALEEVEISVRVMTFGYDTETWFKTEYIDTPSNDLLSSLQSARWAHSVHPKTPIIFIGHGFGAHIAKDAILFFHPGVATGLVNIRETDEFPFQALDKNIQWRFPGWQRKDFAFCPSKTLKFNHLEEAFDKLRRSSTTIIPTMDFVRYQPRQGIKHQSPPPLLMSPREVELKYVDLSKFTRETESQFLAKFVKPFVQMAKSMKVSTLSYENALAGNMRFTFPDIYEFETVFYVDDSPPLDATGNKWNLLTKVLTGAVRLVSRQNPQGFRVNFFQAGRRNNEKVKNESEAFELLRNHKMPSKITTRHPFGVEMSPSVDRPSSTNQLNLVVLTTSDCDAGHFDLWTAAKNAAKKLQYGTRQRWPVQIQICHVGNTRTADCKMQSYGDSSLSSFVNSPPNPRIFRCPMVSILQCCDESELSFTLFSKLLQGVLEIVK